MPIRFEFHVTRMNHGTPLAFSRVSTATVSASAVMHRLSHAKLGLRVSTSSLTRG